MNNQLTDLKRMYKDLLANPGDPSTMLVFSDALEDCDTYTVRGNQVTRLELAAAYRWAAVNTKWPFIRHNREQLNGTWVIGRRVYDWDTEARADSGLQPQNMLPAPMHRGICILPSRHYGGVNKAFILLTRVLRYADVVESLSPAGSEE